MERLHASLVAELLGPLPLQSPKNPNGNTDADY